MYNPEHQERRLAPIDTKLQRKISVQVVVLSLIIVSAIFIALEIIFRAITSLRSGV